MVGPFPPGRPAGFAGAIPRAPAPAAYLAAPVAAPDRGLAATASALGAQETAGRPAAAPSPGPPARRQHHRGLAQTAGAVGAPPPPPARPDRPDTTRRSRPETQ